MSEQVDRLNTVVVKRSGPDAESQVGQLALVVAICDAPTFTLELVDQDACNWRQDLTRPATDNETARYWQLRAQNAERQRDKAWEMLSAANDRTSQLVDRLSKQAIESQ